MIRVYVGENTNQSRQATRKAFEDARNENPEGNAGYFDDLLFDFAQATELFMGENLFGGQNILYFDGILEHPDGERFYRTILCETPHLVFIREKSPGKDLLSFLGRLGEVKEFELEKKIEKRINSFAIADAIGAKNKKIAWVEYEKSRKRGAADEEVHGTIFWGVKSMYLASMLTPKQASELGMKDYTYKTYRRYAENYSTAELVDKLANLKEIYHQGHRGDGNFDENLEQFLLNL